MPDVNEEIVRRYFELKGYFVQTDVLYFIPKRQTGKKSSGYGDIDLIVSNPKTGDKAIVGVSGWHTERITPSYVEDWGGRLFSFVSPLALKKAAQVLGTQDFRKILVVSRLGSKESSKKTFSEKAKKMGVDEVIEFPEILKELIKLIETKPSYDSEVLQTLRLLKIYGAIKV
ncbi:MAG: hypothetical protein AB1485_05780 [Candidatus Thermoplasmatota archaeon]